MDMHAGPRRPFPALAIVSVLLLLCIIPGQLLMAKFLPGLSGIVGITPSFVFLDIPTPIPVTIDLILVPGLLLLIYPLLILFYPSNTGISSWQQALQRTGSVLAGLFAILVCMVSGGFIYYWIQEYLPRNIRNGINSFGINADIYLPYPGYETIHLRGSMVLLVSFIIGISICIRQIRKVPGRQKPGRLTREQRMTPYDRMLQESGIQRKSEIFQQSGMSQKPGIQQESRTQQSIPDRDLPYQPAVLAPTLANRKLAEIPSRTDQRTTQPATQPIRSNLPGLCQWQPVSTFEPAAVNYMPLS